MIKCFSGHVIMSVFIAASFRFSICVLQVLYQMNELCKNGFMKPKSHNGEFKL